MPNSLLISESDFKILDENLEELIRATQSRSAVLIDKSGALILAKGQFDYVPPDDMSVMAAGAFSALGNMVDVAATHITISFHYAHAETIHFCVITPQVFVLLLYESSPGETKPKTEQIIHASNKFAENVRPILEKKNTFVPNVASFNFINDKINEIFKVS